MKKLLVILLVLGLTVPAMASEWNFYGSARMSAFWKNVDKDHSAVSGGLTNDDDADLDYHLQGNSRVGANVKVSDVLSGQFEFGTGVNVRLLYGVWNFGPGSLEVGQDYTPINTLWSNQVILEDNDLGDTGMIFERQPMIQLSFGGLKVAAVVVNNESGPISGTAANDTDVTLPKFELSYDLATDKFAAGVYGAYQTYSLNNTTSDKDVNAYMAGLRGKFNMGPIYVNGNVYYAQNLENLLPGNIIATSYSDATKALTVYNEAENEDAHSLGAAVAVGANLTKSFGLEAGVGYLHNEIDILSAEQTVMEYYLQASLTLSPGVYIIPELDYWDYGKLETDAGDTDQGSAWAAGAKFQINF